MRQHPGVAVLNFVEGGREGGREQVNHLRFVQRTHLTYYPPKEYFREAEEEEEGEEEEEEEEVLSSMQALAQRRQRQGLVSPMGGGDGGGGGGGGKGGSKSPTKKTEKEDKKKKRKKEEVKEKKGGRRGLEQQQQPHPHMSPLQQKRARERKEDSKAREARIREEREHRRRQEAAQRAEASFARRQERFAQAGGVGSKDKNPFETRQGPLKTLMCWVDEGQSNHEGDLDASAQMACRRANGLLGKPTQALIKFATAAFDVAGQVVEVEGEEKAIEIKENFVRWFFSLVMEGKLN